MEVELKFPVDGFERIRQNLEDLNGELLHSAALERNFVLDTREGVLLNSGRLLRVREVSGKVLLTVKEPVAHDSMKVRREYETYLRTGLESACRLFEALGFQPVYRYEKTREEWRLQGVRVCLDSLSFGDFVELEGEAPSSVRRVCLLLGLEPELGLAESYRELELRHSGSRRS